MSGAAHFRDGEEGPIAIEYSLVAIEEIRQQAAQGLAKLSRGGIETAGILYGSRDGVTVRIEAMRPIASAHAAGPSFILSLADRTLLEEQFAKDAEDPALAKFFRIGWFISRTRGELEMNESDHEIFLRYFPEAGQLTLVVRPGRANATRGIFFVRDENATIQKSGPEFDFPDRATALRSSPKRVQRAMAAAALAPAALTPEPLPSESRAPEVAAPPDPVAFEAPLAKEPAAQPDPLPLEESSRVPAAFEESAYSPLLVPTPPSKRWRAVKRGIRAMRQFLLVSAPPSKRWRWIAGGAGFVAAIAILSVLFVQPSPPEPLGLSVIERDGQLQIGWNNGSRSIQRALSGSLSILDGSAVQRIALNRERLGQGLYLYSREGGDVEVLMEINMDGETVRESSHFLGRAPVAEPEDVVAPPAAVPAPPVQRAEPDSGLAEENRRLKTENGKLRERIQQLERTQRILESRIGITASK